MQLSLACKSKRHEQCPGYSPEVCECNYHPARCCLQRFLKKYPTADKNGEFAIITVNPEDWAVDLEDPKKNTVQCCQMCSIQGDIKRVTSPGWTGQPAPAGCSCQWKKRC